MNRKIARSSVSGLDKILSKPFKVLDEGFVRVIDYMGSDASIVQAARVSYGAGTKAKSDDNTLIRYLMRHHHTSPFEMCEIKLHVRVPMDVWRQWIRHRTANVNEYSTRYSIAIKEAKKTSPGEWRLQGKQNRQGSEGLLDLAAGKILSKRELEIQEAGRAAYEQRIGFGVAREQARKDLPLSTYTEAYWKIDLHNLLHFLELRMSELAQLEIRQYANIIGHEIVKKWVPMTWSAFWDYQLEGVCLSGPEIQFLKMLSSGDAHSALKIAAEFDWVIPVDNGFKVTLEGHEIEQKLMKFGIHIPWL